MHIHVLGYVCSNWVVVAVRMVNAYICVGVCYVFGSTILVAGRGV
jgi:hypothetical protein